MRDVRVIVEGEVDLIRRGGGREELLDTIGPGGHFGRKWLEQASADAARARSLVRTMALVSTNGIVARTEERRTIDAVALLRERDGT